MIRYYHFIYNLTSDRLTIVGYLYGTDVQVRYYKDEFIKGVIV